jgi:hypothetical protein
MLQRSRRSDGVTWRSVGTYLFYIGSPGRMLGDGGSARQAGSARPLERLVLERRNVGRDIPTLQCDQVESGHTRGGGPALGAARTRGAMGGIALEE